MMHPGGLFAAPDPVRTDLRDRVETSLEKWKAKQQAHKNKSRGKRS